MEKFMEEKPKAIELLEKAWPNLTEENKHKLEIVAETIALMSERKKETATA